VNDLPSLDRTMSPDIVILREILDYRSYGDLSDITDEELVERFGPQHDSLRVLFHEAAGLTDAQRSEIREGYGSAWRNDPEFQTAWRQVVVRGGPGGAALRALWAFVGLDDYGYVAGALARRHEIKPEHYAVLVAPWIAVTGRPVHPDDAPVAA
jgi:hypothetical protein